MWLCVVLMLNPSTVRSARDADCRLVVLTSARFPFSSIGLNTHHWGRSDSYIQSHIRSHARRDGTDMLSAPESQEVSDKNQASVRADEGLSQMFHSSLEDASGASNPLE
jgi:hypothetical protein